MFSKSGAWISSVRVIWGAWSHRHAPVPCPRPSEWQEESRKVALEQPSPIPEWFFSPLQFAVHQRRPSAGKEERVEHSRPREVYKPLKLKVMDVHGKLRVHNRPKLSDASISRWCHRLTTDLQILREGAEMPSEPSVHWVSVPPLASSIRWAAAAGRSEVCLSWNQGLLI